MKYKLLFLTNLGNYVEEELLDEYPNAVQSLWSSGPGDIQINGK